MDKRLGSDQNEPPNKKQRVRGNTENCNFCNKPVEDVLFHLHDCPHFQRTFSEYSALSKALAKYGNSLDKMDKCRLLIKQNVETEEDRKKVLKTFLAEEREKIRQLEQLRQHANSNLLRIPIVCTFPSCSREQNVSIRGVEPHDLPVRTIVTNEKRPLASRYEMDAVKFRAMFLDGLPLAPRNTNVRKKRTIPPLIQMKPSTSTSSPMQEGPTPSTSKHISVGNQPIPVPRESRSPAVSSINYQPPVSTSNSSAFPILANAILKDNEQIVSRTMQLSVNQQNNVPITVSYRIPAASPPGLVQQIAVTRPVQEQQLPISNISTSANTGLVISSVVSLPEASVQATRALLPNISNVNNNVGVPPVAASKLNIFKGF